jgi:hypothetical protein
MMSEIKKYYIPQILRIGRTESACWMRANQNGPGKLGLWALIHLNVLHQKSSEIFLPVNLGYLVLWGKVVAARPRDKLLKILQKLNFDAESVDKTRHIKNCPVGCLLRGLQQHHTHVRIRLTDKQVGVRHAYFVSSTRRLVIPKEKDIKNILIHHYDFTRRGFEQSRARLVARTDESRKQLDLEHNALRYCTGSSRVSVHRAISELVHTHMKNTEYLSQFRFSKVRRLSTTLYAPALLLFYFFLCVFYAR